MTLAGYLSEYSLAEIFNFVHEGSRTGMLALLPNLEKTISAQTSYVWFESGRVISVTAELEGKDLLKQIGLRKLIPQPQIELIQNQLHQLPQPLGIYLKSRGLLDADQLKLLYNSQTIATVCQLFENQDREFRFEPGKLPPNSELTGISLPAQEVGMLGLRVLKDWSGFETKLPDPEYAIQKWSSQQPSFRLDRHETQLWQLADSSKTLNQLAVKMNQPIEVVRRCAFRLISFKLIQEIPTKPIPELSKDIAEPILEPEYKNPPVSTSFLGNLKNFLNKGSGKAAKSLVK